MTDKDPEKRDEEDALSEAEADERLRKLLGEGSDVGLQSASGTNEMEDKVREIEARAAALKASQAMPEPPEWNYKGSENWRALKGHEQKDTSGRAMGMGLAIGYAFVGPVLVCAGLGALIDGRFGGPYTGAGLFVGFALALFLLIKLVNRLNDAQK